jgi:hypothetical protein
MSLSLFVPQIADDGTNDNYQITNADQTVSQVKINRTATFNNPSSQLGTPLSADVMNVVINQVNDNIESINDKLGNVYHDGTLLGDGTTTFPLSVTAPGITEIAHDSTLTGNGTTTNPLSVVVSGQGLVQVAHDSTLTGDGTTTNPLSVVENILVEDISISFTQLFNGVKRVIKYGKLIIVNFSFDARDWGTGEIQCFNITDSAYLPANQNNFAACFAAGTDQTYYAYSHGTDSYIYLHSQRAGSVQVTGQLIYTIA